MKMMILLMMLLLLTTRTLSLYSNKIRYSSLLLKPSSLLKSSTSLLASSTSLSTKVVGDVTVDVNLLQNLVLNDANGNKKKLGTVMGKDKSVVIFLRHLGKIITIILSSLIVFILIIIIIMNLL